jgi:hypothetical protein
MINYLRLGLVNYNLYEYIIVWWFDECWSIAKHKPEIRDHMKKNIAKNIWVTFLFWQERAYSISLIKACSIQSGISTIIWKLALDVATLAKLWATSFAHSLAKVGDCFRSLVSAQTRY